LPLPALTRVLVGLRMSVLASLDCSTINIHLFVYIASTDVRKSIPSREAKSPELCCSPRMNEGSGAPTGARGGSPPLERASDAGPQGENARPCIPRRAAYAVRAPGMLASRRSTAAAYWRPVPRGVPPKRVRFRRHLLRSSRVRS
jgi:hypothetical protein